MQSWKNNPRRSVAHKGTKLKWQYYLSLWTLEFASKKKFHLPTYIKHIYTHSCYFYNGPCIITDIEQRHLVIDIGYF